MKTVDIKKHQIHVFTVTEHNILTAGKKIDRRKSRHKDINFLSVVLQDDLS